MAHVSGNAVWQDWPSTATLVTATAAEGWENTRDALYVSEYGSLTRTQRANLRIYWLGSVGLSSGDAFVGTGWTAGIDTEGGWAHGSPSTYTVPYSGRRWDLAFHLASGSGGTAGLVIGSAILLNGTSVVAN